MSFFACAQCDSVTVRNTRGYWAQNYIYIYIYYNIYKYSSIFEEWRDEIFNCHTVSLCGNNGYHRLSSRA